MRSFFVGGQTTRLDGLPVQHRSMVLNGALREVNPNGAHMHGQMYVQHYQLTSPTHALPVLLWHGGGMTGATWETTPDGRSGWLWRFLQSGFNVYVSDAVERGRSSFAMTPHIFKEEPVFRTKEEGWKTFRLGLSYSDTLSECHIFEDQLFPTQSFNEFTKQWVPRWPGHEAMILAAYEALVRKVGPCIIVGHSQGAGFAAEIARRLPAYVRAVVAVEPGGMPSELPGTALAPHLVVWGDHIELSGSHWVGYRDQAARYFAEASKCTQITELDLPAAGIKGNSHFPMMDVNSDDVFQHVVRWITTNQP
ncbi:esterase [Lampropedia puyangensis]|uniref:Esterase n=1 Tax=Lampropedia puyangensis TaxID=1330072 RepID=A0A4S8FCA2_9BURK|nr:esterase [Lampropedia puyangensis]